MLLASLRRPTVDHDVSPPPLPASLCTVPAAANPDFKPSPGAALCGFEPLFTTKGVEWHRRRRPSEERRRCPRSDAAVDLLVTDASRSEERRVGKEGVRRCRVRWSPGM